MISMGWFVKVPVTTLTLCLFMISMGWFVKVPVTTLTCESVYDIDGLVCLSSSNHSNVWIFFMRSSSPTVVPSWTLISLCLCRNVGLYFRDSETKSVHNLSYSRHVVRCYDLHMTDHRIGRINDLYLYMYVNEINVSIRWIKIRVVGLVSSFSCIVHSKYP